MHQRPINDISICAALGAASLLRELQADRRGDVGEDGLRAGQLVLRQRGELVGGRYPRLDQVGAGARHRPQRAGVAGVRVATQSRCRRAHRHSARMASSQAPGLAPDCTSPSRRILVAFGETGTAGAQATTRLLCGGTEDPAVMRPAPGRSPTGALRRVSPSPVRGLGTAGGGGAVQAVVWRLQQTVTPAHAESQQRAPCRCPQERVHQ